jgi:hypothetical protein
MTAAPGRKTARAEQNSAYDLAVTMKPRTAFAPSGASRFEPRIYCAAKTNGTVNVAPSDRGKTQFRTCDCTQLLSPG